MDDGRSSRRRRSRWRLGTPLVVLLCGGLFVVSAQSSEGTDLRPGRYDDLAGLTRTEANRYAALESRIHDLNEQVADLTAEVDDDTVQRYQDQVAGLSDPAGLTPQTGPGLSVTLSDTPRDVADTSTAENPNVFVVHQQDIQAVVNAMWRGGARAVTVQGQRVITTTGIKCEGNSVMLQGVPYPSPYVIKAVGDVGDLTSAVADDPYLQLYRGQSVDPDIQIGWDVDIEDTVKAPAYDGLLDLTYATPAD